MMAFGFFIFILIRVIRAFTRIEWFETLASDEKFATVVAIGFFSLIVGFILGELIRHIIILKKGDTSAGSSDKMFDGINNFSTRFLGKAKYTDNLDYDARAAVQVCSLFFGTNQTSRHKTSIAMQNAFVIQQSLKREVTFGLNVLKQSDLTLSERLREFKKRTGKQMPLREALFGKIVAIGMEIKHPLDDLSDKLVLLAKELEMSPDRAQEIVSKVKENLPPPPETNPQLLAGNYGNSGLAPTPPQNTASYQPNLREQKLAALGLHPDADQDAIETAFQKLSHTYNPEILRAQNRAQREIDNAVDLSQEINAAYEWLRTNQ